MKRFDKDHSLDELFEIIKDIESKSKFSELLKKYESVKDFLENIYNKGYDAGRKSKIDSFKNLN